MADYTGNNKVVKYSKLNFNNTSANVNRKHSLTIYINCNIL